MRLATPPSPLSVTPHLAPAVPLPLGAALASAGPLESARDVIAAAGWLLDGRQLDLSLPARGDTRRRYDALAEIAAHDLSLARICEGHTDAMTILGEAGRAGRPGLYGVWAAEAGDRPVVAQPSQRGWTLRGCKRYASGATGIERALVTARTDGGGCLFDVDLASPGVRPVAGTWQAVGMAATESLDVAFEDVVVPADAQIGHAGFYLARSGFWHGAVDVAACWYGGALGAFRMLRKRLAGGAPTDHQRAHLGAVAAACEMMRGALHAAADEIDASAPADPDGRRRALVVRHIVEQGCQDVLARVGRAAGTSALVFDRAHARRAADLVVYLRQHHAERDLADLGSLVLGAP